MSASPLPLGGLAAVIGVMLFQRVIELVVSARNLTRIRAHGGVEFGREHFPGFVVLHALLPVALVLEVVFSGTRPLPGGSWLVVPLVTATLLRLAAIRSLGERWHVGVWVVPGAPRIRSGIYAWASHPNYIAVAMELVAFPLLLGAWRTALGASLVNAVLLGLRLRTEERALAWAEAQPPSPAPVTKSDPGYPGRLAGQD